MKSEDTLHWISIGLIFLTCSAEAQTVSSDFDGSGSVEFGDFLLFAQAFGSSDSGFDLDNDGQVGFGDFLIFAQAFGSAGSTISSTWTEVTPDTGPPGRLDHTIILDPTRSWMVMFGGRRDTDLDDTWIYDLAAGTWREVITTPRPDVRRGHVAVYDASRDQMVIFGGENPNGFRNDTWVFSLSTETWSELNVDGGPPSRRYGLSAIMDLRRDRMVISHGFTHNGRFDDTWTLDLATRRWSRLSTQGSTPQARCLHDAAYDVTGDRMFLFGGCSSGIGPCPRNDLWTLDLATSTWEEVTPATSPAARSNLRLACRDDGFYLFGGSNVAGTNDLWRYTFDSAEWREVETSGDVPPVRWSTEIVWDEVRRRMIAFGGTNGALWYGDLWQLEAAD